MAQLNLALDTVMKDTQSTGRGPRLPPSSGSQIADSPPGRNLESIKVQSIRGASGRLDLSQELQKQQEINRRLNDLLNQKDDEIARLSQKILQLEEDMSSKSPSRSVNAPRKGITPAKSPRSITQAHGAVTDLENKLIDAQRENKDL